MKLMRTCKEVAALALLALERPLPLADRMTMRMHLWMCRNCTTFMRQVSLMQGASARWRRYTDESGED